MAKRPMAAAARKQASITVRAHLDLKAALEQAALEDGRSVSSLVDRVLRAWLVERGHLPRPGVAKARARKAGGGA